MKIINLSMILLLTISLSSCRTAIVCSQINSAQIKPLKLCDASFQFNRCRCRCFDMNKWQTLPLNQCGMELNHNEEGVNKILGVTEQLSDTVNYPLEACDGFVGFNADDMANEIRPKIKKLDAIKGDYCK